MKARNIAVAILFVIAFFALGYFRNFIFLTVNEYASATYYHTQPPTLPGFLSFAADKSYPWLLNLKWVLTFLFLLIYCALSAFTALIVMKQKHIAIYCIIAYSLILSLALLLMGVGYIFHTFSHHAFNIARSIVHLGHSPIPIVLILCGTYFSTSGSSASKPTNKVS